MVEGGGWGGINQIRYVGTCSDSLHDKISELAAGENKVSVLYMFRTIWNNLQKNSVIAGRIFRADVIHWKYL